MAHVGVGLRRAGVVERCWCAGEARARHRREGVVGALALVDVVVGVYHLGPQLAAQDLDRAVGDHLVGVHVALRAAARLPHHQREVVRQRAVRHLRRGLHNGAADLGVHALAHVNLRHIGCICHI